MTTIAVDASWLQERATGIQQYTEHLLGAYAAAYPDDRLLLCNPSAARLNLATLQVPYGRSLPLRLLHHRLLLPRALRRAGADWYFAPNFVTYASLPSPCRLLLLLPDLAYLHHPEWCAAAHAAALREQVPRCLARAAAVITISTEVAAAVRAAYPAYRHPLQVIEPAVNVPPATQDDATILARLGVTRGQYLLGVGTREPRKDWPLAVAGFQTYRESGGSIGHFVIAGGEGWGEEEQRQPRGAGVILAGAVGEAEKWMLYRNAAAYLSTSRYEGYGMPLAEALACGLPAAATLSGGATGTLAGRYTPIADRTPAAVAVALHDCLRQPRREQPVLRTWTQAAAELRQVLRG